MYFQQIYQYSDSRLGIPCHIFFYFRYFPTNQNPAPQTQPVRCNGNGHIPGNGHAVPVREHQQALGMYELETYAPMLDHLPENENSDSKVSTIKSP